MKSNVILKSTDRELFGVTVRQNTKEQFLSLSDLQKAYDLARWQYGWGASNISVLLNYEKTQQRIYHLLFERGIIKLSQLSFMEMVKKEGMTKVLKGLGVYKTTGRGENKTVMSDPYIWILVALELNPMLYAKVVMWLTDSLIFDRIEAGSEYRPMNAAIKSISPNPDYTKYAKIINVKVFGQHQSGMRNIASASELRKIADIEKFITQGIEMGMITHENGVQKAINMYK